MTVQNYTVMDDQPVALLQVYQGDEDEPEDWNEVVSFSIADLPKRKAGAITFEDTMTIDGNGLVTVKRSIVNPPGIKMNGEGLCTFSIASEDALANAQFFEVKCL